MLFRYIILSRISLYKGSRIFIQDTIYDKFLEALIKQFNSIKVGNSMDINTQMGAQINQKHMKQNIRLY